MTFNELIGWLPVPPSPGDHEIVRGPDDRNHLVVVATAHDVPTNSGTVREFSYVLACGILDFAAVDLEVVRGESITCVLCIQWRTT